MTPRNIRRAAERQAAKLASKTQKSAAHAAANSTLITATTAPESTANAVAVPATQPIQNIHGFRHFIPDVGFPSPAQIAANQANAQHSTGPKTDAGKKTSSMNSLKTGLTGRSVLLPNDDLAAYDALLNRLKNAHQPATEDELALVQSLVDTAWRLERIVRIEFTLYATGAAELADEFNDLAPADRAARIQMETHLKHEKTLRNLNTQEARLRRLQQRDTAELKRLQSERQQKETEAQALLAAQIAAPAPAAPEIGFVFENAEIPTETGPSTLTAAAETGFSASELSINQ